MIFLLNQERVIMESMELARLKISEALSVPPKEVTASIEIKRGKLRPKFNIQLDNMQPLEKKYIKEGMSKIWLDVVRPELFFRLEGLKEKRYGAASVIIRPVKSRGYWSALWQKIFGTKKSSEEKSQVSTPKE